jgi:DNA-binding IclR family transcriptional regulator
MTTYKRIAAVSKAGYILKYLADQKEPCSGADIANAVDLQLGTVMCHLATLEDLGFVQRIGDRVRLGMGIAMIWARVKSNLEGDKARIEKQLDEIKIPEEK